ncbi:hypothetical protein CCACVL1_29842 [Corchorus capsularis]|uniref:Uncharacterized protein n=1 Tax=Corchorus capsularis TaxID=210143 RepID=A0A1R3FZZ4_COCAP|nr:hypothetical protein CCACVL1_29842 [Corchorus capsularis]
MEKHETLVAAAADDWRIPYLEYFVSGKLPSSSKYDYVVRRSVGRFFVQGGILFRKSFNVELLRCLSLVESQKMLDEVHAGECASTELDCSLVESGQQRLLDLEAIDEKRSKAKENGKKYQDGMALLYNRLVKKRTFSAGQLVLKAADHIRRNLAKPSKFAANWEGPFIIKEAFDNGYYKIEAQDGSPRLELINAKWLKPYYC